MFKIHTKDTFLYFKYGNLTKKNISRSMVIIYISLKTLKLFFTHSNLVDVIQKLLIFFPDWISQSFKNNHKYTEKKICKLITVV